MSSSDDASKHSNQIHWINSNKITHDKETDQYGVEDHTEEFFRSSFRKDIGSITHFAGFRKLKETKQVYSCPRPEVRDRLTHSLEVSDLAKQLMNYFIAKLNEGLSPNGENPPFDADSIKNIMDMTEFSCIVHDIGHPPYAHASEQELDQKLDKRFFDSNVQNLRILARLSPVSNALSRISISSIDASIKKKHHGIFSSYKYIDREQKLIELISKSCGTYIKIMEDDRTDTLE